MREIIAMNASAFVKKRLRRRLTYEGSFHRRPRGGDARKITKARKFMHARWMKKRTAEAMMWIKGNPSRIRGKCSNVIFGQFFSFPCGIYGIVT